MRNNSKISIIVTVLTVLVFAIAADRDALTAQQVPRPSEGASLASLASAGKVRIDSVGTGETIGHVADLKIQNLTDQPINCAVGPMVGESKSRKNQDYVCPKSQTVNIAPHGTATVPLDGVCI